MVENKIVGNKILKARVMHKRLLPKINYFNYRSYYISLNLNHSDDEKNIAINRFGLLSFYYKDHGHRDGRNPKLWAEEILQTENIDNISTIYLMCMPRILHYVFNPISFYLCYDRQEKLRAIICEVNNTFGDSLSYLCTAGGKTISENNKITTQKLLHVSPFFKRQGSYEFRFHITENICNISIDYYSTDGKKLLLTSLSGFFQPMTKGRLRKFFWGTPLLTFKVIFLIHYQAFKLLTKGMKYIKKPEALPIRYTK